uniref:Uncharacterized protein n=1 Tax=Oryzias melastigma TaxID=30732 RepID=A0A3B3CLY5_ORYME
LLLVALAVPHGVLLGLLQGVFQRFDSLPAPETERDVSSTTSPLLQRSSSASSFWMTAFRLLFFSFSFSYFFFHSSAVSSRFTQTVFLMDSLILVTYLCPNMSVDLVSASL